MAKKVYCYALRHGPDSRHLVCSVNFPLLKDAKKAVANLTEGRAHKLWSLLSNGEWGNLEYGRTISEKIV